MARPRKTIDKEQVKKLAALNASYAEMASFFGCNESTLTRRFAQAIKDGRHSGNLSLKRKQFEIAMSGNVGMLIWLGKQNLGQRQEPEVSVSINNSPSQSYESDVKEILALIEARECSQPKTPLSLVPSAGLLAR